MYIKLEKSKVITLLQLVLFKCVFSLFLISIENKLFNGHHDSKLYDFHMCYDFRNVPVTK